MLVILPDQITNTTLKEKIFKKLIVEIFYNFYYFKTNFISYKLILHSKFTSKFTNTYQWRYAIRTPFPKEYVMKTLEQITPNKAIQQWLLKQQDLYRETKSSHYIDNIRIAMGILHAEELKSKQNLQGIINL
jgi:hypothetical protein